MCYPKSEKGSTVSSKLKRKKVTAGITGRKPLGSPIRMEVCLSSPIGSHYTCIFASFKPVLTLLDIETTVSVLRELLYSLPYSPQKINIQKRMYR